MKKTITVLLVDDDPAFRHVMSVELERLGYRVTAVGAAEEAIAAARSNEPDVVLLDLRLPGVKGLEALLAIKAKSPLSEVIMLTGHGSIDTAIESIRSGAFDYVLKPCPLDELDVRIQRAVERRALRQRNRLLESALTPPDASGSFVGESREFRRILDTVGRVATSDSTVLITGETGSGKEQVAKMLHARSPRRFAPFVIVECAALQESLLQSELFGHERGSFTGAERAKPGLFEVADGGTVFLDEIGEVSLSTQSKLLRVLDTSTFRHVGGTEEIHVNVRILAATNRDVQAMVKQGHFREDLYYRLSTIRIEIPPLRDRGSDVDVLAAHFVEVMNERFESNRRIGSQALEVLRRHTWPGNVRELLHAIEAAMVVCDGDELLPDHFPLSVRASAEVSPVKRPAEPGRIPTLEDMEREHIRTVLEIADGHRGKAAKLLGISERSLYRKLQDLRLIR